MINEVTTLCIVLYLNIYEHVFVQVKVYNRCWRLVIIRIREFGCNLTIFIIYSFPQFSTPTHRYTNADFIQKLGYVAFEENNALTSDNQQSSQQYRLDTETTDKRK